AEADLDRALTRVLGARFHLGEFDPPEQVSYRSIPTAVVRSADHRALALQAARKAIVLLKNDGLLPLAPSDLRSIALIGPHANRAYQGGYSGNPGNTISPLQGVVHSLHTWIEAESASELSSSVRVERNSGRAPAWLAFIRDGDFARYDPVDFGWAQGSTSLKMMVSAADNAVAGTITIRLDSQTGPIVGTCDVPKTGGWQSFREIDCGSAEITGAHAVVLQFIGPATGYL